MINGRYDVIIVGSGPGGGTLALSLAETGKRILILERGEYLPRERDNWDAQAVFVDGKYQAKDTWYDRTGASFRPGLHYGVGGNSKVYGGALYRLREEDFGALVHEEGVSPAWPLGYDVFEPYYTKAEQLFHVHGLRGADPTEPWASAPYPYAPVRHEPRIQALVEGLERIGHRPYPQPLAILLDEENGRVKPYSACVRCDAFDGFPCLTNGKADAQIIFVDPALAGDRRGGTHGDRRPRAAGRRTRNLYRRHRRGGRRRPVIGAADVPLGQRGPSGRTGQRLGPGGPQLHAPQ